MTDLATKSTWFDLDALLSTDTEVSRALEHRPAALDQQDPKRIAGLDGGNQVTAGKGGRAYNAHSYPTKVPPEAIEPFLEHYTSPGATILDPFCGSGMTGLAALRTGRAALLNDLSALAVHLAYNHTTACDPRALRREWIAIRARLSQDIKRLYGTSCKNCHAAAETRYTIWSDVYRCPECDEHVNLWDAGVDKEQGKVARTLTCPSCAAEFGRSAELRTAIEPTWMAHQCACSRGLLERELTPEERTALLEWDIKTDLFSPMQEVASDREMYRRSALHLQGIESVSDFYTDRNLEALSVLWNAIGSVSDLRIRTALAFAFTNTAWHGTRMRRFNARGGHRPLTGTLYIPQLSSEANVFEVFGNKISYLVRFYEELSATGFRVPIAINHGSATDLSWIPTGTVDYIFTDPPFGSNIFYADCNLIAEAWLGTVTDDRLEAVVNRSKLEDDGAKSLEDYRHLMALAFGEMHRVLRAGRWATVVFQSSDGEVWRAIEEAAAAAGFSIHSADILDKVQQSMKGYKGRNGSENVASFDIVLHLHKADSTSRPHQATLTEDQQRTFLEQVIQDHLRELPSDEKTERSLPYLYSLSVRSLLNGGYSVHGLTMDGLRQYLAALFTEDSGLWYEEPA